MWTSIFCVCCTFFFPLDPEKPGTDANILHLSGQSDLTQMMDGLAIDDLDKSSGCSFPFEESRGLDMAGSTREASESFSSHEETEISLSMSNKDEACKDENSAPDQCRQAQYSREAGEEICLESDEIPCLEGGKIRYSPLLCNCFAGEKKKKKKKKKKYIYIYIYIYMYV